jgi:hypothetical protein
MITSGPEAGWNSRVAIICTFLLNLDIKEEVTKFMQLSSCWEAASCAALAKFPTFYGTRKFITLLTRAFHWSLSWTRSVQSIPSHPISVRSISILSTHLRLGLSSGLPPSGFSTNNAFLFSPYVLHPLPISSSLAWSFQTYLEKSTSYETPRSLA